jgi:hypothetical protein
MRSVLVFLVFLLLPMPAMASWWRIVIKGGGDFGPPVLWVASPGKGSALIPPPERLAGHAFDGEFRQPEVVFCRWMPDTPPTAKTYADSSCEGGKNDGRSLSAPKLRVEATEKGVRIVLEAIASDMTPGVEWDLGRPDVGVVFLGSGGARLEGEGLSSGLSGAGPWRLTLDVDPVAFSGLHELREVEIRFRNMQ